MLSNNEKKLLIHLLREYANTLGDKGCNDFDLSQFMSETEIENFVKEAYTHNDPKYGLEEFNAITPSRRKWVMPDWWIVSLLARRIENE